MRAVATSFANEALQQVISDYTSQAGLPLNITLADEPDFTALTALTDPDFILSVTLPNAIPAGYLAVPLLIGPISIAYNIPLLTRCSPPLNLTMKLLGGILTGRVAQWYDAQILALNPFLAHVAAGAAPLNISRVLRADYDATTDHLIDAVFDLVDPNAPPTPTPVAVEVHDYFYPDPRAGWARISAAGARTPRYEVGEAAAVAAIEATVGAVGFAMGGDVWERLPVATIDGARPTNATDVQLRGLFLVEKLASEGHFTISRLGAEELPRGYPLVLFVSLYARAKVDAPPWARLQCCARVYWTAAFVAGAMQADTVNKGFIALGGYDANSIVDALPQLVTCGGMSYPAMRARYDLSLDEVTSAAATSRASRQSAVIGGAVGGGSAVLLVGAVVMVFAYFRRRVAQVREMEEDAAHAPRGEVGIMFTDIESSSRLWRAEPAYMKEALALHFKILRQHVRSNGGYEVKTEGDAMFAVFPSAVAAVRAACGAQEGLLVADWAPQIVAQSVAAEVRDDVGDVLFRGLRVRMGVAMGHVEPEQDPTTHRLDYFGDPVNYAARVADLGHGGQVVVSDAVAQVVGANRVRCGMVAVRPLPAATLAGFDGPQAVHEVTSPVLARREGLWAEHRATKADAVVARIVLSRRLNSRRSSAVYGAGGGGEEQRELSISGSVASRSGRALTPVGAVSSRSMPSLVDV